MEFEVIIHSQGSLKLTGHAREHQDLPVELSKVG